MPLPKQAFFCGPDLVSAYGTGIPGISHLDNAYKPYVGIGEAVEGGPYEVFDPEFGDTIKVAGIPASAAIYSYLSLEIAHPFTITYPVIGYAAIGSLVNLAFFNPTLPVVAVTAPEARPPFKGVVSVGPNLVTDSQGNRYETIFELAEPPFTEGLAEPTAIYPPWRAQSVPLAKALGPGDTITATMGASPGSAALPLYDAFLEPGPPPPVKGRVVVRNEKGEEHVEEIANMAEYAQAKGLYPYRFGDPFGPGQPVPDFPWKMTPVEQGFYCFGSVFAV